MEAQSGRQSSSAGKPNKTTTGSSPRWFVLRPQRKLAIIFACVVAAAALAVVSARQDVRPDPNPTSFGAWFWSPLETNALSRLPVVTCTEPSRYACRLNGIWASNDGTDVWAVGNNGLVLQKHGGKWTLTPFEVRGAAARTKNLPATKEDGSQPDIGPGNTKSALPASGNRASRTGIQESVSRPRLSLSSLADLLVTRAEAATREQPQSSSTSSNRATKQSDAQQTRSGTPKQENSQSSSSFSPEQSAGPEQASPNQAPQAQSTQQPLPNPSRKEPPAQGPEVDFSKATGKAPGRDNNAINQTVPVGKADTNKMSSPSSKIPSSAESYKNQPRPASAKKKSPGKAAANNPKGLTSEQVNQLLGPAVASTAVSTDDLLAVYFTQRGEGWIVGRSGQIYHLAQGGNVWEFAGIATFGFAKNVDVRNLYGNVPIRPVLKSAQFLDEVSDPTPGVRLEWRGFVPPAAGNTAPIFVFTGTLLDRPDISLLNKQSLRFESTGVRVADSAPTSDMRFRFVYRASAMWWGVGDDGLVMRSKNEGGSWLHETQGPGMSPSNRRLPGPWYWVLMSLLVAICLMVMWAPEPQQVVESVADWVVTDAPLKPGDLDALDFTPVALGLSRFIRNPKTQPPVTLAIEGKWGEGKSSLMSLLCGDLKKSRLRPVWFNAWHHQSEEQLLASLLENIRKQGLPPWWHLDNIVFRGRLLFFRFGRMWPLMTLLLLACVWTSTYEIAHHGSEHPQWTRSVTNSVRGARGIWDAFWNGTNPAKDNKEGETSSDRSGESNKAKSGQGDEVDGSGWAMILSILGFFGAIGTKIKAFGVDTAKLATQVKEGAIVKDLSPQPGIRRQFAREFDDVCRAWNWGSRRVIIFIDDLDRCRPDNVVTVLEAVNFLTTAGDCFVVLGIAPDTVTHCVGLSFKDVAESQAFCAGVADDSRSKALARYKFGANYIRKLVNISVALPKTTYEQRARVLEAKIERATADNVAAHTRRERAWMGIRATAGVCWKLAPATVLLALAAVSAWMGYQTGTAPQAIGTTAPVSVAGPVANESNASVPQGTGSRSETVLDYKRNTEEQAKLHRDSVPPQGKLLSFAIYVLIIGLLVSVVVYLLTERSNEDAQNSPQFEDALAIWAPCIVAVCDTPRELKRVVNDLRYRAMTGRNTGPTVTRGERITEWLRKVVTGRKVREETVQGVDEAALVPQAVLAISELLILPDEVERFRDEKYQTVDSSKTSLFNEMMEAKRKHLAKFPHWPFGALKVERAAAD